MAENVKRAVDSAFGRVFIIQFGDGFQVHTWSPRHAAASHVSHSHTMGYAAAVSARRLARIRIALELLGVTAEDLISDPDRVAQQDGDWRTLVYKYAREHLSAEYDPD